MKILLVLLISFVACSSKVVYSPYKGNSYKKISKKELIKGKTFYGEASYYGKKFHGRKTANGEIYNMNELTCANKELPFNTLLKVTNLSNNKSVVVRVNDRGPYRKGRIIDLSYAAAKKIGMNGTAKVKCTILGIKE